MPQKSGQTAIPYEILRRDDGEMAVSASVGLIKIRPRLMRVEGEDLVVLPDPADKDASLVADGQSSVRMKRIPDDLQVFIKSKRKMSLLEFSIDGRHIESELILAD
jgi:hypothetical protein